MLHTQAEKQGTGKEAQQQKKKQQHGSVYKAGRHACYDTGHGERKKKKEGTVGTRQAARQHGIAYAEMEGIMAHKCHMHAQAGSMG